MNGYKNIYINGCSFTAGDNVPEGLTWPDLLQDKTKLNLRNSAKNGNSMGTIAKMSIMELIDFSPKDTLVIIGLTWAERYSISIEDFLVNVTPADLGYDKTDFEDKLSTWRRISSYRHIDQNDLDINQQILDSNRKNKSDKVLTGFRKFYELLVTHDSKLKENQLDEFMLNLLSLQMFLESFGFTYRFIDFQSYKKDFSEHKIFKLVKKDNIIDINCKELKLIDEKTAHPSEYGCEKISNIILKNFNYE